MCACLCRRRFAEACVGYAESHDQALVGDKTIAFWLMDKDMYDCMVSTQPWSGVVDQGEAKMRVQIKITGCMCLYNCMVSTHGGGGKDGAGFRAGHRCGLRF